MMAPAHAHHWIIEEANGPKSMGDCKTCGARRKFINWDPGADVLLNTEQKLMRMEGTRR